MTMTSTDDLIIGSLDEDECEAPDKTAPTSLTLTEEVDVNGYPTCVHHYKGYTYVGHNDGLVSRINLAGAGHQVLKVFRLNNNRITGITAHNHQLFTLQKGNPYMVYVHDLSGRQVTRWRHSDHGNNSARALGIINSQLVVANRTHKCFTVYSITGQKIQDVKCNLICNDYLSMCLAHENSIIVANYNGNSRHALYKVNFRTGRQEWRSKSVSNPIGVVMHGARYVIVSTTKAANQTRVWILDQNTGL